MIEARDLTKFYGHKAAVDHLSFTVEPGRVTGFLGPNGAGKSTTMRLILGLDRPQADVAHINAYLPEQAGTLITHTHEQSGDLLSPWQGFGVLCIWTILALAGAAYLLNRRDA